MREAKLELIGEDETTIFGNPTGKYWVRCYEDGLEMSGSFYKDIVSAQNCINMWERGNESNS